MYLEQHFDNKKAFSFDATKSPKEYSTMYQWLFFAVSHVYAINQMLLGLMYYCIFSMADSPQCKAKVSCEMLWTIKTVLTFY